MQILLANHSSYPHADVSDTDIAALVREQESCGLNVVTDGQSDWADPFSHVPGRLAGVRLAGAARFPGTNCTYRQPIVEGKLRAHAPLVLEQYRRARAAAAVEVKPVLTGPCTLARLSQITTTAYGDIKSLGIDYRTILAQEVHDLVAAGASMIQIDEPMLLHHPEDVRLLRELLDPIQDAARATTALVVCTYWGPATALYAQLSSLPGAVLAVDLCSDPELTETIAAAGCAKILALGIVDGRSPRLEDPDSLARLVERVLHRYVHNTVYLQPSCGLRELSSDVARAKLETLALVRRRMMGSVAG
jgi:5-methyltetrahydropteroyltriglutamate--homocysteine methyltransferase